MANFWQVFVVLLFCATRALCGKWFNSRLMRNPGLLTGTSDCHDGCIANCLSTPGCSAISWQESTGSCLVSTCNAIDLVSNNGWNSYVLDTTYVEGLAYPPPRLEWMLTDVCGVNNLSPTPGPKLNFYNTIYYNSSFTANAGFPVQFQGTSNSYAVSDSDTRLYNPFGYTSQTVMFWINYVAVGSPRIFFEFSVNETTRGILYWLCGGGLWYDYGSYLNTSCSSTCSLNTYSWVPQANVWNHIAFVYDGSTGSERIYLNMSLVATRSTGIFYNYLIWNTITFGRSKFDTNGPVQAREFCFKEFNVALYGDQIKNAAMSCLTSRTRFS